MELLFDVGTIDIEQGNASGGDSIDILDGLNPSLNHFPIRRLPKLVLNLVLNPHLNSSLKF